MSAANVDAVIIGGGPAGLSAALVLGRCRRDVVVFDDGRYRNARAKHLRAFLTRDQIAPAKLRELARDDLGRYPTVRFSDARVTEVRRVERNFVVSSARGEIECRAVLVATGFVDTLPDIDGVDELDGDRVVPCPYCDAYEVADEPLAVYSHPDDRGARYAFLLTQWSDDVVFCAPRRPVIGDELLARLAERRVRIETRELRSVARDGDGLRLEFGEGEPLWRRTMFYHLGGRSASRFAAHLGAKLDENGNVVVDRRQESSIRGLYVAGDASRDVFLSIVAAGEGTAAAVCMNQYLTGGEIYAEPTDHL